MTLKLVPGCRYLPGGRTKEGYRIWNVEHLILSDEPVGPALALQCPGLPLPGDMYVFTDDVDPWAYCGLEAKVTPMGQHGKSLKYKVEQPFSSEPNLKWCKDQQIDDPLLQPPKISGNFIRYTEEATHDRFGSLLQNSSWEQIRGPQVEFDADRLQIEIEQNVLNLDLPLLTILSNTVNASPMWGVAPRIIKFTAGPWSMNFYGMCHRYFTRKLIFEARKDGWDRVVLDEGTKVLSGQWNVTGERRWILKRINGELPNPNNPAHFIRYKDPRDENTRVVLDGKGKPFIPNLVTIVTDCPGSGFQLPSKWVVNEIYNQDVFQTPLILTHTGGCTWVGTWEFPASFEKTVTLQFFGNNPNIPEIEDAWEMTIEGAQGVWKLNNMYWKSLGPNVMTNRTAQFQADFLHPVANIYPNKLTLTSGNSPGVRAIQKYEETDSWLLLGIPIVL